MNFDIKQPSTWRGLVTIVASIGALLNPLLIEPITAVGVALIGLIEVVRNEEENK